MPPPTPADQIRFLTNVQRLLAEGSFVATYKYALLAALADLSVALGDDSGSPLLLSTFAISEKLVEYYWHHATPYATAHHARPLRQNIGGPARVLSLITMARQRYGDSMPSVMRDRPAWESLVRSFIPTLNQQPLWQLQVVGSETLDFLYGRSNRGDSIELRPGIAYCFRQFHSLVQDVVRAAWLRHVRSLNSELPGAALDLREFLFGAERGALAAARPVLRDSQAGRCFYCAKELASGTGEVDHFIPWTRYPADLAHNLVLTDRGCNRSKRDRMPHVEHLARWAERNFQHRDDISIRLAGKITCDLNLTRRIAHWAYAQTEQSSGLTWLRCDDLVTLSPTWADWF